jgi:hypothetical protein
LLWLHEVIPGKLYSCAPDDDIHMALQTMKEGKVRRLPVIAKNGPLVGVVSMDDILLRAEPTRPGKEPELSSDEVVRAYRAITQREVPQVHQVSDSQPRFRLCDSNWELTLSWAKHPSFIRSIRSCPRIRTSGSSSKDTENVQILCGRHDLSKRDKIE